MRSMKVFISGRVTGLPRAEAIRNFDRGKKLLMLNTFNFVNPLDLVPENATPTEAMSICIAELLKCDGILLLDDHKQSEGSQIEKMLAGYCGKEIIFEDDLI